MQNSAPSKYNETLIEEVGQILKYDLTSLPSDENPFTVMRVYSVVINRTFARNKYASLINTQVRILAADPSKPDGDYLLVRGIVSSIEPQEEDCCVINFAGAGMAKSFNERPWLLSNGDIDLEWYEEADAVVGHYQVETSYMGTRGEFSSPAEAPSVTVKHTRLDVTNINPSDVPFFKKGARISGLCSMKAETVRPTGRLPSYNCDIKLGFELEPFTAVITAVSSVNDGEGTLSIEISGWEEEYTGHTPPQNLSR